MGNYSLGNICVITYTCLNLNHELGFFENYKFITSEIIVRVIKINFYSYQGGNMSVTIWRAFNYTFKNTYINFLQLVGFKTTRDEIIATIL